MFVNFSSLKRFCYTYSMNRLSKPKISFSIADIPVNINIRSLFAFAQQSNVDGVEIVLGYKTYPGIKSLARLSNQYNIPILSIHKPLSFGKLLYPIDEVFQITKFFQAKLIIHPLKAYSGTNQKQQDYLSQMEDLQGKYKVDVLLENLSIKSSLPIYKYSPKAEISNTDIINIYKLSKKHHFGVTFDTSHFNHTSIHTNQDFIKILPSIKNIHLSDFDGQKQHLALGEGKFEAKAFLQLLKRHKYNKLITMELSPHIYYSFNTYCQGLSHSLSCIKEIFNS